jgi:hypothetical protein
MKRSMNPAVVLVLAGALILAIAGCAREPAHCWVCDREIHRQVMASIHLADGKTVHACCPRCALHYEAAPENRVRGIEVRDFVSGADLPFGSAYFVEGSDEAPCLHHPPVMDETRAPMRVCYDRCLPSLIAFRTAEEAQGFMTDHGGALRAPGSFPDPGATAGH